MDDEADGVGQAFPLGELELELRGAGAGEGVEFGLASGFGGAPLGTDPALVLQAMEGGIKSALGDLQSVFAHLLDAFGDGPAVLRLDGNDFQDQQIEGSVDEIGGFAHEVQADA